MPSNIFIYQIHEYFALNLVFEKDVNIYDSPERDQVRFTAFLLYAYYKYI